MLFHLQTYKSHIFFFPKYLTNNEKNFKSTHSLSLQYQIYSLYNLSILDLSPHHHHHLPSPSTIATTDHEHHHHHYREFHIRSSPKSLNQIRPSPTCSNQIRLSSTNWNQIGPSLSEYQVRSSQKRGGAGGQATLGGRRGKEKNKRKYVLSVFWWAMLLLSHILVSMYGSPTPSLPCPPFHYVSFLFL